MHPPHSGPSAEDSKANTSAGTASDTAACFTSDSASMTAEQALTQILSSVSAIEGCEILSTRLPADTTKNQLLGRILHLDLLSPINVPGFRNSAMDGYAYCNATLEKNHNLDCIGSSLAGHPYCGELRPNQCIRVTTGAKVPDQADTVVMQEHVSRVAAEVTITTSPPQGLNIREVGSNISQHSILLKAGSRLGPAEAGLIASVGITDVSVCRKLKICIFSTGDELCETGQEINEGQIYDSNRALLSALLSRDAFSVLDLGIIKDTKDALAAAMTKASESDIVISSGGVSVGDADYVREILEQKGTVNLWRILMKPGRPLTHGTLDTGACYFGLPGNPVSGIVTFYQFVLPALRKMTGEPAQSTITFNATTSSALEKQPGRMELQRGILQRNTDNQWTVESTGLQDSHVLLSMSRANCFIVLAIESAGAAVGEVVEVVPFQNYLNP